MKAKIWVVDDERIIRVSLADDLRDAGFEVREFSEAAPVLIELAQGQVPDIVISDIKMQGMNGIELLERIKKTKPEVTVLLMTAFGAVEDAVAAMKMGAYEYILKPFNTDEILIILDRILELNTYKKENKTLKEKVIGKYSFSSYIGSDTTSKQIFELLELVVNKDTTVLIIGETGTGKELVTNIIHHNSRKKNKPLIKVSCAILSREIFESELFGHVKGAFTGADSERMGRFEMANHGTLYLDDIDDIPLDLQVKLLRAIEEREIERVGSSKPISIDVRIIASTKKDLFQLVKEGTFREDLYYRLNVFPIRLLPLRERKKDIKSILIHYLKVFSDKQQVKITKDAVEALLNYNWPGNVRELKNIAERLAILANGCEVDNRHIPIEITQKQNINVSTKIGRQTLEEILTETETSVISCALLKANGNKTKAAKLLSIPLSTLRSKMEKLEIKKES